MSIPLFCGKVGGKTNPARYQKAPGDPPSARPGSRQIYQYPRIPSGIPGNARKHARDPLPGGICRNAQNDRENKIINLFQKIQKSYIWGIDKDANKC